MNNTQFWHHENWLSDASTWIEQQLRLRNVEPKSPVEKVSGWALGQILRQSTNRGVYYFKATALLPLFSNEAQLCLLLAKLYPEVVPTVVAADIQRQLMLTESFGVAFCENESLSTWAEAFFAFSQLQVNTINNIESLKEHGCLYRPIEKLPLQLTDVFACDAIKAMLPRHIKSDANVIISAVHQAVEALQIFELPESLVHGDLHIENIARKHNSFMFFDWSDACISHPFIDGTYIYRMAKSKEKDKIVNAYLAPWHDFLPIERLTCAWQTAEIVCYAHQAVSYASMFTCIPEQGKVDLQMAFEHAFQRLHQKALSC
ncbi:phosphotransferase family protein [Shewanella gelidii]|nr:phosphotransferase [Shewanella gelidii]MCL1098679.1 aminoglycoside phosphotransferase family protein [Shewanella gelidii]